MNIEKLKEELICGGDESQQITMVIPSALEQLEQAVRDVVARKIPGDFIETGVWRGGACILVKALFNELNEKRKVFVADSFQGLPKPNPHLYPDDMNDIHYLYTHLAVSEAEVRRNFERFNLLDESVVFIPGFFSDTIPTAPVGNLAILRLDGDMFESTWVVLEHLYEKVSPGGYIIVDDYVGHPGCEKAVNKFRKKNGITAPLIWVEGSQTKYWIK